jgi:hypothetical protein
MARPERFELPTTWFEAKYSIQLSYGRFVPSWAFYPLLLPHPHLFRSFSSRKFGWPQVP